MVRVLRVFTMQVCSIGVKTVLPKALHTFVEWHRETSRNLAGNFSLVASFIGPKATEAAEGKRHQQYPATNPAR